MRSLLDVLYVLGLLLTAPIWLFRLLSTGKWRTDWPGRFGRGPSLPPASGRRLLIHAVSVGEVNALRTLVDELDRTPGLEVVISTTTNTGVSRATALYGDDHAVVRYPFDFSWAVSAFLRRVKPDAVALVELELWPNFTDICSRRGIPLCVINGRLSARSASRYRRVPVMITPSLRRLEFAAVQTPDYARRFAMLGMQHHDVLITDSMKWDTAMIADDVDGAAALAHDLGIDRARPLIVAGSTAPDEHAMLRDAVPDGAQLVCAPRRPEWFDDAARTLPGCVRRTLATGVPSATDRYLLDTIGELRMAYALADIVVVGRSFGDLHGSDMMEPIALGKPVIIGPATGDFEQQMTAFRAANAILVSSRDRLARDLADLLEDDERRREMAARGRDVIRAHQGATARHAELLRSLCNMSAAANTPASTSTALTSAIGGQRDA